MYFVFASVALSNGEVLEGYFMFFLHLILLLLLVIAKKNIDANILDAERAALSFLESQQTAPTLIIKDL